MAQLYTDAPESYDGFSTRTIAPMPWRFRGHQYAFRLIELEERDHDWQYGRYLSGMYCCLAPAQFTNWCESGLLQPAAPS